MRIRRFTSSIPCLILVTRLLPKIISLYGLQVAAAPHAASSPDFANTVSGTLNKTVGNLAQCETCVQGTIYNDCPSHHLMQLDPTKQSLDLSTHQNWYALCQAQEVAQSEQCLNITMTTKDLSLMHAARPGLRSTLEWCSNPAALSNIIHEWLAAVWVTQLMV
eukprot:767802-Pelagomonas_calceolata.AAC.1